MAHDQEVMGSNPGTIYWMDVSDDRYYIQENNENKGSKMGHTKKKSFKKDIPDWFPIYNVNALVLISTALSQA
jgi:hypothetical protein